MRALRRLPIETRRQAAVLLGLFAVVAAVGATRLRGQTAEPSLCGNGVINAPEECDEATRNGTGPNCTQNCTKVKCGDGIVSRSVGEECDTGTGSTAASCGRICSLPECDENGENCAGGCRWTIVACASSSSSRSSASGSVASVSSVSSKASSAAQQQPSSAAVSSKPGSSSIAAASSAPKSSVAPSSAGTVSSAAASAAPSSAKPSSAAASVAVFPPPSSVPSSAASVASVASAPSSPSASSRPFVPVCGDGLIHPGEQCDDGNRLGFDGCSPACQLAENRTPRCGDGQVRPPEECDAGAGNSNVTPDACRTNCMAAFCGDGVRDAGEACDDGNADEYDGCTWKCEISVCGNGVIEAMEECDVGGQNSNEKPNVCRLACRKPFCGDGVTDAGEECDDANKDENDACTPSCVLNCPDGSSKIQGRCLVLKAAAEECGALCKIGNAWDAAMDWLYALIS